jgi:signal transduction histidine kinase
LTVFGLLRNGLAKVRDVKLSTFIAGLFAAAIILPWCAYAWLTLAERSEQVVRTEHYLAAVAAAYGEHAALLATQSAKRPESEEMVEFLRALNAPQVQFSRHALVAATQTPDRFATTFRDERGMISAEVARPADGIVAVASLSKDEALKSWREGVRVAVTALVLRTLLIVSVGVFLVHQLGFREKLQAELLVAQQKADSSNRAKSEFLANMSHELRTPLNAIIGFSEVIKNQMFGPVSERYRDYAADIFSSGTHLLALINEILDLSKLEAGQLKLREENVDLRALVEDCLSLVEMQAQRTKLRLSASLDDAAQLVRADEKRLRQILINLLSNAVKFTPEGGEVRVSSVLTREGLAIAVSDTGIGIAPGDIPKAMMPFGQVDSTISRQHEGTGLGLPLSKHLAELHGGRLTLASALNAGTTVTIVLPYERVVVRPVRLAVA